MTKFLLLLSLKALFVVLVILYSGIGLGPDEAQYWTWSQALDWGYFSKPPGIAWQIGLGTKLFGQTEWGVRSMSVLLAFLQAWAVYSLALNAGLLQRTAFWCGLIMAFSPIGILGSLFAITDGGFLLCWTGACITVVSALNEKKEANPLLVGGWILAGALFKWPIYLFWIFFLLSRAWYFPNQKKSRVMAGILLSLVGLAPSIWWNGSHDWATFRHVLATLQGGSSATKGGGNFFEFIGTQAFLLSPILFILLVLGLIQWMKKRKELSPPLFFCGFVTLASLVVVSVVSGFQKVQGNWCIFLYPTGIIILGWSCFELLPKRAFWAKIGMGLSLLLATLFVFIPSFYPIDSAYARYNPLKHNMGWMELQNALKKNGYDPDHHFLVSDKYQGASLLSFYGEGQKRAYFLNLNQIRKNQFSYWPSMQKEQQGQTGYFIWIENSPHLQRQWKEKLHFYQEHLKSYFEKIELSDFAPLISLNGEMVKGALIFRCENCKNVPQPDSDLY